MAFIAKWLVGSIAVGVAVWLVPGIEVVGGTWPRPSSRRCFSPS